MLQKFIEFVAHQQLYQPNQKILLALSGGIDSVVLCDLLAQSNANFDIAHCNFQLRAEESEADEYFAKQLAQKYQKNIWVQKFDTKTIATEQKASIQMVARQLRYDFFQTIAQENQLDYIATAHHQNDLIETVLLNLVRGTGIAGLHGILPKQQNIIRPLLFATKEQIRTYALENQLLWREDSSNISNKYYRNKIRNEVIPILKNINPNLENTFQQTLERLTATENILEQQIELFKKNAIIHELQRISIDIQLLQQSPEPTLFLWYILQEYGFSYQQCKQIITSLATQAGKKFYSLAYMLLKDREALYLQPKPKKDTHTYIFDLNAAQITLPHCQLTYEIITAEELQQIDKNPQIAYIDADKISFPLQIRLWQAGDFFYPLGMKQRKKISDFLINQKIDLLNKQQTYVLLAQEQIVWLIGLRLDNRFALRPDTKKILKITQKNNI